MNEIVKKVLNDFQSEHTKLYGTNFLFEVNESVTPVKVTVMTEKLAEKLRQDIGDSSEIVVVSLDKDESAGKYYKVTGPRTDLWHYYRDGAEWNRLMEDLDPSMVTFKDTPGGDKALRSELIQGEVFRGLETSDNPGNLAVAVCHDFEDIAPKQLGWIEINSDIEQIPTRVLTRPEKLATLEEEIEKYVNLPYHLSGKTKETGMDCSGLVQRVMWEMKGLWLPRTAKWQALIGESKSEPEKGDIVIVQEAPNWSIEHIGVFVESGKYFQSSRHTNGVVVDDMPEQDWFKSKFKISDYRKI